jgi:ketosteroid isomerase-like protein
MSEENIEIVRRIYEATARGDTASVLAAYDENVEFDLSRSPFREFFPKHVVHGHEGLRAFFRERHEAWDWMQDECLSIREVGDRVVTEVVTRGQGRTSGIETELSHYGVWSIRDGLVIRTEFFASESEALEAAARLDS